MKLSLSALLAGKENSPNSGFREPVNQTVETLCGHPECDHCHIWRLENENHRRQIEHDACLDMTRTTCADCKELWKVYDWDNSGIRRFKESFAALDLSARMGCLTCRLVRQGIVYEIAAFGDIDRLSSSPGPIDIRRISSGSGFGVYYPRIFQQRASSTHIPFGKVQDMTEANVQPKFGVQDVLQSAAALLDSCRLNNHRICSSSWTMEPTLPTRVIDVGNDSSPPCILITEGQTGRYCTLSYCWGEGGGWYSTTRDNLKARTRSIPFVFDGKSMPKAYHDAIVVTRRLMVRYLWIDALCIIQDDADDWQTESARMTTVFQNSYCTLAADGARNSSEGFLRSRPAQELELRISALEDSNHNQGGKILLPKPNMSRLQRHAPLYERGWVQQERLLSPRLLHFTPHCLYFECQQSITGETHAVGETTETTIAPMKNLLLKGDAYNATLAHQLWLDTLYTYTATQLTKTQDRLPAIAGVASGVQLAIKDDYLAGLWRSHLSDGLQWAARYVDRSGRPEEYIAPSWSWASTKSGVSDARLPVQISECTLEVIDIAVRPVNGDNPFGQVKSGYLRVRAPVRYCPPENVATHVNTNGRDTAENEVVDMFRYIQCDTTDDDAWITGHDSIWLMEVCKDPGGAHGSNALVLLPTGVRNQYRRIGFAVVQSREYFDSCGKSLIEII